MRNRCTQNYGEIQEESTVWLHPHPKDRLDILHSVEVHMGPYTST